MGHARPSPRKELAKDDRSRSLVGYTPSQPVDYDVVTLNPPIRTSTPVYAQEQGYGRATPPLPPYSISEVDESLYEPDSRLAESLLTPRPASAPWPGRKDDLHDEVIREMERRADEFYRTGMVGRCWDVWHRAVDWFQVRLARSTIHANYSRRQHIRSMPSGIVSSYSRRLSNGGICIKTSWIYLIPPMPIELIIFNITRCKFGLGDRGTKTSLDERKCASTCRGRNDQGKLGDPGGWSWCAGGPRGGSGT